MPQNKNVIGLFFFLLLVPGCSPTSILVLPESTISLTITERPTTITPSTSPTQTPAIISPKEDDPILSFRPNEIIHDLAYSPGGIVLAVSAGSCIHLYKSETLEELADIQVGAWANRITFHPNLPLIILAVKDGNIQIRETLSGKLICQFKAHEKGSISIAIHPDGSQLVTTGTDITSRLWDISSLKNGECDIDEIGTFIGESYSSPDAAFSPDGNSIALVDMSNIRLRKTSDRKLIALLESDLTIFDIAFSPDGRWLAAAQHQNTVTVWDLSSTDNPVATVLHPPDPDLETYTWRVAFNPESKLLAAGTSDGSIAIWDLDDLRIVQTHHLPRAVSALAFSVDGEFLAAGGLDASVWLFPLNP